MSWRMCNSWWKYQPSYTFTFRDDPWPRFREINHGIRPVPTYRCTCDVLRAHFNADKHHAYTCLENSSSHPNYKEALEFFCTYAKDFFVQLNEYEMKHARVKDEHGKRIQFLETVVASQAHRLYGEEALILLLCHTTLPTVLVQEIHSYLHENRGVVVEGAREAHKQLLELRGRGK